MTATNVVYPSNEFMRKHFGWNWPLVGRLDTGIFCLTRHGSLREQIRYVTITAIKHLIIAQDRHFKGIREIIVFQNYQLLDTPDVSHFRKAVAERIALRALPPDFEQDLYDELSAYVLGIQPFAEDWWEWFAGEGTIGARFKSDAKDGGNKPCRTLEEMGNIIPE